MLRYDKDGDNMGIYDSNSDYNKYKVFYAVAECNSFSKAAMLLHISQPAISYAVKELESQLNTKLFIRDNRTIKLTDDGEKLVYYLKRAFNDINIAEKVIKEKNKDYSGIVKIGMYEHLATFIVPQLFSKFIKKYPNVKFELITSSSNELKEKLKNRELDFIITQYPLLVDENNIFVEEKLFELENCFFATKEIYDKYINNDLSKLPLILPFRGYVDIDTLDLLLANTNIKIKNNFRIYSMGITKELVLKNLGIGWGPKKCIEKELKNKVFYELLFDFEIPNSKFSISYNDKALNDTTKEFIKLLKDEIKDIR